MVLKNVIWQLPVLEPASHDEWLELIQEYVFKLLFLEKQEEVIKQEVTILDNYTEFDADSNEIIVPLFLCVVLLLLQLFKNFIF